MISLPEDLLGGTPADARLAALQKTVSASRLNCWAQCRLKFFFRYGARLSGRTAPALNIGRVVHSALQAWNLARWRGSPFTPEDLARCFAAAWEQAPQSLSAEVDRRAITERARALAVVSAYIQEQEKNAQSRPMAVEVHVEANLEERGLTTLVGVLDLVERGDKIIDYKTAGHLPSADTAEHLHELQTSCYSLLYRHSTGRKESAIELHHLVKLRNPRILITRHGPMTERQETRLYRLIDSYLEGVARCDFVPSPGLNCVRCEYFTACRKWAGKELWARE